jgi:ATP-dependent exoDNAse (exonuclease V) beta subunit
MMNPKIRFISAGAGSGKTYELTQILYKELTEGQVKPGGVLATTFTRKAATELRERVRGHLIGQGAYMLANAMGQARIGTVNGICGALLERFAFEAGLPTEQLVLDEARAKQLLREAMDVVMEDASLAALLQVVRRLGLDVVGFAGGEVPWRKALSDLVNDARANDIAPDVLRTFGDINADRLLAHFPAAAGGDLDAQLRAAITHALPAIQAGAAATKTTRTYLDLLEDALKQMDSGNFTWGGWNKLSTAMPAAGLKAAAQPVADIAAMVGQHPGLHADIRDYLVRVFALAADALAAYADLKKQVGAVDFTDQERSLLDILDEPSVAQTLTEELDLVMVDEFQDTSPIQLALFLKLAGFARKVVWVGDVKQAIYGFRGSDSALMKSVVDALPVLGGAKSVLPFSYRSRPALVGLVNELFGDAFVGLQRSEVELKPKRGEMPESIAVHDWMLEGSNQGLHLEALASGVAQLLNQGTQVVDAGTNTLRPLHLGDIAILAKSNATVKSIAACFRQRRIATSTAQPGLLAQPEIVLALACLRRLNDASDTLATAEIVSLADCAEPESWLANRLAWLDTDAPASKWKEEGREGFEAHPIVATLKDLRAQAVLLSPSEAVAETLMRCGIARRVIQWQQDSEQARLQLANLDQLTALVAQYEDECDSSRQAATLSGLLLWLQALAAEGLDAMPQSGIDAVQVMTHHGAKGLEWPVVVLCDLASDVRDRLWGIQAEPKATFDVHRPLHDRFLRYWPWAFGAQKTVPLADDIALCPTGIKARDEAVEEHKRLLYVSMTRARDMLILARPAKKAVGEWMSTVSFDTVLPAADTGPMVLKSGVAVPFARTVLSGASADLPQTLPTGALTWFDHAVALVDKLPLTVSPSSLEGVDARVAESVVIGSRMEVGDVEDRSVLGQAIHACLAADLASDDCPLDVGEVLAILQRMGVAEAVDASSLHRQVGAVRAWLRSRWPDAKAVVELPMQRLLPNGQTSTGRADLLLRTATGWVLFDHKSTQQGSAQWATLASSHAGQLAAYGQAVEAVSGLPVEETWLVLPVAGAAIRVEFVAEPA